MKNTSVALSAVAILLFLGGCSDVYTEIDGENEETFYDSVAALKAPLTEDEKRVFEFGMAVLRREGKDHRDLDGMDAEDIMDAEFQRLEEFRISCEAKLKNFNEIAGKFTGKGSEVPDNISTTIEETKAEIAAIDKTLNLKNSSGEH